ncbi:MAG: YitT family protein [Ignavibacteriota bacterium]|nr:MAG: YitT family protein [Chlorobiota bacterium]MBE7477028.1 YitT family protein [Ignavibacteriales bacterium]MBL1121721.1 YitT family protein [Ignavibacteriota bacterium]MCC7094325.1 YitT family protein [Ignavibacteriaceae bacterium]MCE7857489.1 YitT family protein [Ignavibacteria bacterium CHB3]MEB2297431.1 YitT family protein [Ignavibacteria bacterium]
MNTKKIQFNKKAIRDYIFITIGAAIMAIGIGIFLVDAKVVPGGVSGLSMAIYYLTGGAFPIGITIWLFNIPLFIWGVKELGTQFGARTFFGFTLNSFFIDFFRGETPGFSFIQLQNTETILKLRQDDFLFLILLGAALLGIGLGLIFKFRGSTAGSDIVAAIMQKRFGVKPGMAIMIIDFFVILIAGFIIEFKDLAGDRSAMTLTLYALFLLFVSARLIDAIIDGFDYARAAYIISDKNDEIAKIIMNDFSRGATAIKARGLYRNTEREILVTVVALRELGKLTSIIKQIDPHAFVTVNNVFEVLGEGFRRRI